MTNLPPTQTPVVQSSEVDKAQPTPVQCLMGGLIAGGMSAGMYLLTISIAQTFANKPIHSTNITVLNIASAVRTLVVGVSTLGTGIFGLVALGLTGLAIQLMIQKLSQKTS